MQNPLDRLRCLNGADHSRQHSQHAGFGTVGRVTRTGRLGKETTVTRTVATEEAHLAFEAEHAAVHVGNAERGAGVVDEIARRKIVGAVDHDVMVPEAVSYTHLTLPTSDLV